MPALNTDLYQLTMAAGYFLADKTEEQATFELTVRRLPPVRNFLVAAGLQQAVEYLHKLQFQAEEIAYLRSLEQFQNAPPAFFEYLAELRFAGDLFAVPEGTPIFPNEPIAIIRAPLIQAQLVETCLLSTFAFQTSIASKAARCVIAAQGRSVVEFGSRRAHSPAAGVLGGRAAYIGGCSGTSNTEAGMRFGIPVFGTAAHSWTMSFPTEEESFRALQHLLGKATVFLIDTYDTLEGARLAARLGPPFWGVRLDSGDLVSVSRQVRRILDDANCREAKIFATNDLNEYRIAELVHSGAPVDGFGVGTELATSADAPALSAVYKLVEIQRGETIQGAAKFSREKSTLPAAKQIYRTPTHDVLAPYRVCDINLKGEPLLRPVMLDGSLLEELPSISATRDHASHAIQALPERLRSLEPVEGYEVKVDPRLVAMAETLRREFQLTGNKV